MSKSISTLRRPRRSFPQRLNRIGTRSDQRFPFRQVGARERDFEEQIGSVRAEVPASVSLNCVFFYQPSCQCDSIREVYQSDAFHKKSQIKQGSFVEEFFFGQCVVLGL